MTDLIRLAFLHLKSNLLPLFLHEFFWAHDWEHISSNLGNHSLVMVHFVHEVCEASWPWSPTLSRRLFADSNTHVNEILNIDRSFFWWRLLWK